ncbi:MAG: class I SAM-dependent methyltransferase [Pseudomonadaceae bacterium]|nr:class I SAM-dependent methyltransferase [Pseudomonadaceae bacterium]
MNSAPTPDLDVVIAWIESRLTDDQYPESDARRLFHGRGHSFPGFSWLTVDRYADYILIAAFGEPDEVRSAVLERLVGWLHDRLPSLQGIVLQSRQGRRTGARVVHGEVPDIISAQEAGLTFELQPMRNQNVGLFLDMRPVRDWLRSNAQGKRVLNLFAYTCAFSVHAVAGGASTVVNNDMARPVLDWGVRNHRLNGQGLDGIRMLPHNLLKSWGKMARLAPFDIIVSDPPTNQGGSFNAEKHYPVLFKKLSAMLAPAGQLVACLNSPFAGPEFLRDNAARYASTLSHRFDFPVHPDFPDATPERSLKVQVYSR